MTPREHGRDAGFRAARDLWVGFPSSLTLPKLPAGHQDRQDWIAGYASGIAEYNRTIQIEGDQS